MIWYIIVYNTSIHYGVVYNIEYNVYIYIYISIYIYIYIDMKNQLCYTCLKRDC